MLIPSISVNCLNRKNRGGNFGEYKLPKYVGDEKKEVVKIKGVTLYLLKDQLEFIDSALEKSKGLNNRTYIILGTKIKRALDFLNRRNKG